MDRRDLLKGAGSLLAAGAALGTSPVKAVDVDSCDRVVKPATFVLVHGAWCGGFVYDAVAAILRKRGHRVFAPTLTGLGARSHLFSPEINLTTHITDIANLIRFEELSNVVLAGHSYAGMVITGVADRSANRIASLVYLDAVIPEDGDSVAKLNKGTPLGDMIDATRSKGERALAMPPELAKIFKIPEADLWKYTPQPLAALLQPIHLTGAQKTIAKKTVVRAGSAMASDATVAKLTADPSWKAVSIDTGHMMMMEKPERTAEILEAAI
jgi:pimeloyl-ACP methyl ester carboxylesterase